jgi:glycosyltransferase involved in cell wall biosynthesis
MEKKITILYIITSTNVGGTERALLELIKRIDRTQFDILVCSLKKEGAFSEKIKQETDGFYCLELSESGGILALLSFIPALISLFLLIRYTKPDIIHSFLFRANIIGRLAGRMAGVKKIISSIRVIEANKPFKHFLDRNTSSLVTVYTAVSEAVRNFTIQQTGLSPDKIITIQNGIDCSLAERTFPGEFKTNKAKVNIGLFGRLDKQKGHLVLLNAVKKLISKEKEIRVFFFGEGPDEDNLKEIVMQKGLSEYINFMGVTDNIYSCILQMDIIAIPSLWEGLPNILLESMVLSKPVIASKIDGITEVVTNNINALLFNSGDENELSENIQRLIYDKNFAYKLGANARKHVVNNFSIDKSVQKTTELYFDLSYEE